MDFDPPTIRKKVSLYAFGDAAAYCKAVYEAIRKVKASYTIHAYSHLMGFGENNTMAQVHSGHRKLSVKSAERICKVLELNRSETSYFLNLVELSHSPRPEERERLLSLILELRARHSDSAQNKKGLEFFNSWLHSVVFELLFLDRAQTLEQLCNRISIPVKESAVEKSLHFLESLNFVTSSKKQDSDTLEYCKTQKDFSLGGSIPGLAIVRYHQEMLNLAKESMINSPPSQRDISSVTISIDPSQIERIKQDIEMFRKYLLFLSSQAKEGNRVMQLNIQLFPLSK